MKSKYRKMFIKIKNKMLIVKVNTNGMFLSIHHRNTHCSGFLKRCMVHHHFPVQVVLRINSVSLPEKSCGGYKQ